MSLQAIGLSCVKGRRVLFEDLRFDVQPGQALRIAGRNGSGKTSLLRMLCGLAEPTHGEVQWQGVPIRAQREAFCQGLAYIGHGAGLKDELTAWENVRVSTMLAGRACSLEQALHALDQVGLSNRAAVLGGALSQGQRRRVLLARLFMEPRPSLMVLDEPFNALDQESTQHLSDLLGRLLDQGTSLIYTTHQNLALQGTSHHVLQLGEGALEQARQAHHSSALA